METYHFRPGVYLEAPIIILTLCLLLGLAIVIPTAGWPSGLVAVGIYLVIFFSFGAFSIYSIKVDACGIHQYIEGKWLKYLVRKAPFDFNYSLICHVELVELGFNRQELRIVALDGQYFSISSSVYPSFAQLIAAINLYVPVQCARESGV